MSAPGADVEQITLPMACVCSDEGKALWAAKREEAYRALEIDDRDDAHEIFVSNALMVLHDDGYDIEIIVDQWFGVAATKHVFVDGGEPKWKPVRRIFAPCDMVELGLVAIYLWVQENDHAR